MRINFDETVQMLAALAQAGNVYSSRRTDAAVDQYLVGFGLTETPKQRAHLAGAFLENAPRSELGDRIHSRIRRAD